MPALRDALRELSSDVYYDLAESESAYHLDVDVPGASPESVDVTIDDGTLVVSAVSEATAPAGYETVESGRSTSREFRLTLPDDVTGETVETSVARGVLSIRLEKSSGTIIDVDETD